MAAPILPRPGAKAQTRFGRGVPANGVEGVRFSAQVAVPNVVLGLFAKRPMPTRVAGTVHAEQLAYQLVQSMVRRLGPDPFWVRVVRDQALLVHQVALHPAIGLGRFAERQRRRAEYLYSGTGGNQLLHADRGGRRSAAR